jgi:AcrR family transcriptional regulator
MARPREFDEATALDAAIHRFWLRGCEATSVRELAESMGITSASLYNAFGDKRSLFTAGQKSGEISTAQSAQDLARLLLGTLLGIRVLARTRPEPILLVGLVCAALALLDMRAGQACPAAFQHPKTD